MNELGTGPDIKFQRSCSAVQGSPASCSQKGASLSYQSLRKFLQSPVNIRRAFNLEMQKNILSDEGEMEGRARLHRNHCSEDSQHPWEDTGRTSEQQGDKSFCRNALHYMQRPLWRSAECCNVLCIHGETTQLLVFKNPFAKLENLINICVS